MTVRILVVDDDRDLLDLVELNLKEQNPDFDIISAVSVQDALRTLEETSMDAIVCDYHLGPDQMNGVELLAWLRKSGNEMPFIIFTGRSREDVAIKALNLGADFYMKKEEEDYESLFAELAHHISSSVESRKMDQALTESEARFRHMFESSLDGIIELDSKGKIVRANKAFCDILSMDRDTLVGEEFVKLIPESWQEQEKYIETILAEEGKAQLFEEELRAKDGRLVNVALSRWTMDAEDGAGSWILVRDISNRKAAERQLRSSEERFRSVFKESPIALTIFNANGELIDANRTTLELFGVDSIEAIMGYSLFFDPDLPEEMKKSIQAGKDVKFTREYDFAAVQERGIYDTSREGKAILLIQASSLGLDEAGDVSGYVLQMQDVTEDIETKKTLDETLSKFQAIFNSIPVGIALFKPVLDESKNPVDFVYLDANNAFKEYMKLGDVTLKDTPVSNTATSECFEAIHWHDRLKRVSVMPIPDIFDYSCNETKRHYSVVIFSPMSNMIVAAIANITEQAEVFQKLESQRQELSEFAHQLKHDLNSHLLKIRGFVDLIDRNDDHTSIPKIERILEEVRTLLEHSVQIADAGLAIDERHTVDLNELVEDVGRTHLPSGTLMLPEKLPSVEADPVRLKQVFQNLFLNAVEHGKATQVIVKPMRGEKMSLLISNNGSKIPEEAREHIFKRGFTTDEGKMGYGLAITRKVVEAHNWHIYISDDAITTFVIVMSK